MKERSVVRIEQTRFDPNNPVLIDQPDIRLTIVAYLLPLLLIVITVVTLLLPLSGGAKFAIGYGTIPLAVGMLARYIIPSHGRLRKAVYTITTEHVEAKIGTFEKSVRRIPLGYIRDVTHTQNIFQSLYGLSDIKVVATNGDSIVLENISEGERKREIIWELVFARSPHASRPRT